MSGVGAVMDWYAIRLDGGEQEAPRLVGHEGIMTGLVDTAGRDELDLQPPRLKNALKPSSLYRITSSSGRVQSLTSAIADITSCSLLSTGANVQRSMIRVSMETSGL